jgi:hypothetical protein
VAAAAPTGPIVAWGFNVQGQTNVPAAASSGITAIAAGGFHSLALRSDGTVVAWGDNSTGQTTIPAAASSGVIAIAGGGFHSLALKSNGMVVAWGDNSSGQTTIPAAASSGVIAIAGGGSHSLALKSNGMVVAWGDNSSGQTTVPAAALSGVTAIAAGGMHSLALKSDGTVVAWGDNTYGQTTVPASLSGVRAIAAGTYHSLALKSDGTVVAWGLNDDGETDVPAGLTGVTVISAGYWHNLALVSGATYHALTPTRILDSRDGTGGLSGPFNSHVARTFTVIGHGGVPSGAIAVTGNLTVTQQTSLGYLFIGPVAMNNPTSSTLNFPVNDDRANAVTVALSGSGTLSITYAAPTSGSSAQVIFDVTGYFTPDMSGATYHALTPARILDSRDGTGGLSGAFSSHVARTFTVTGHGGVPGNATAVTGNLTVTGQTNLGYLSIGPVAMNNPTSSTLNFPLGDDRANAVTVALGAGGTLSVTYAAPTLGQTAQVIFDVTGYFTPDMSGATYHALTPARILDSRDGTGGLSGAFSSHVARTFTVWGDGGVPSNTTAVTGNLTVTQQTSLGYLSIGPVAQNNPTSSTLNFPLNDDRANAVTVALSGTGTLSITYAAPTSGATAQVIFDVTGYFTP